METCRKCGAELRSEQKVCIKCGTRTVAGGNYDTEDKKPFKITRNMIYAGSGVVVLLLILLAVMCLKTVPPDVITTEWFDAMLGRHYDAAERFHSEQFTSQMQQDVSDTRAISDFIYDEVTNKQAKPAIGPVTYDQATEPPTASVNIALSYPDTRVANIQVMYTKFGRRWLISGLVY